MVIYISIDNVIQWIHYNNTYDITMLFDGSKYISNNISIPDNYRQCYIKEVMLLSHNIKV